LIASLLTKCCKTFRAIQLTAESGLGQDASVLARQLFEIAVAVKFILQRDTLLRATMFAAHEDQRALVALEEMSKIKGLKSGSPENVAKQRAKVKAWEPSFENVEVLKSVRRHWSGDSLQWAAKEVDLLSAYATMYRYTSTFAHGSDPNAHFFIRPGDKTPTLKLVPGGDEVQPVLDSSIILLAIIFEVANETLGLGEDDVVERIKAEVRGQERRVS
jgi:hypothetical protein